MTKDMGNPVNQSKLAANVCNRREARESVCDRVMAGVGFTSDLAGVEIALNLSRNVVVFVVIGCQSTYCYK